MKCLSRIRHFYRPATLILVLVMTGGLVSCLSENTREEVDAAEEVTSYLGDHTTLLQSPTGFLVFEMGSLDEGVAVYLLTHVFEEQEREVDAAFWVKGEEIFVVNDKAQELAPDLPQAPSNITYERVREVVH